MKSNRNLARLGQLRRILNDTNQFTDVECVQAVPSREVVLIQLADFLLGAVGSRLNNTLSEGTAKEAAVLELERRIGQQIAPTRQSEHKFNIFRIDLEGGG